MATGRMLRAQISSSPKVNDLSLKSALLFTWLIPHVDDFGRIKANPRRLKALVAPMREDISVKDVEDSLAEMSEKNLIRHYFVEEEQFLQLSGFEKHQSGLHKRTASKIPSIDGDDAFCYSEKELEDHVSSLIDSSLFHVNSCQITSHNRQERINNSYLDIFGNLSDGRKVIIEIKRQKITKASIAQIVGYAELVGGNPALVLIGCGISSEIEIKNCPIILAKFEKDLSISNINFNEKDGLLFHVNSRSLTLINVPERSIPREEKRREENGREENLKALSGKPDVAPLNPSNLEVKKQAIEVLEFLNEKTGKKFRNVDANLNLIIARLKSGITVQKCFSVIAKKRRDWIGDEKMAPYLRPATLFNKTKFEQYLGELLNLGENE